MLDYVEIQSGPNTLRGMLHAPDGPGPHPCVMLLHGFTGNRVEAAFLFVKLAKRLRKAGIACLRFDFAGSGESDGEFEEMTASGEVADAEAALDFLRAHQAIDPHRIGAAGLSLGGCVGALLAGRRGPDVKALALMAALANPDRAGSIFRTDELAAQLAEAGYMEMTALKVSGEFVADLMTLEPAAAAGAYAGPVLIVHGSADETLPVEEAQKYRQARADSPHTTRFEIIPDAGHVFMTLAHTDRLGSLLTEFFTEYL